MDKIELSDSKYQVRYSKEFKRRVCEAYLNSNSTKVEIWRKYVGHANEHGSLLRWLRQLGYIADLKQTKDYTYISMSSNKDHIPENPEELKRKIRELEKALKDSQLKEIAYKKLIEVAERELKINIRKK